MTVTYYGGGHEAGSCTPSSGNVHESQLAGTFDPDTSIAAMAIGAVGDTTSNALWTFASATATPNVGFMGYGAEPGFGGEYVWLRILNAAETDGVALTVIRKDATGSGDVTLRLYYGAGVSYVAQCTTNMHTLQKFDIAINAAVSGSIQVFIENALAMETGTVDLSALPTMSKLRVYSVYQVNYVSETILSNSSTVGLRVYTQHAASEGPDTGGTGAYTDIDEAVYSDVDGISFASAGLIHTFTPSTSTLGGFGVEAVLVCARAKLGTTGPTKLDLAIRSASDSTNHFSSDVSLTAGYGAAVGIWQTDPGTSAAWTATNATGAKFGGKSIA